MDYAESCVVNKLKGNSKGRVWRMRGDDGSWLRPGWETGNSAVIIGSKNTHRCI